MAKERKPRHVPLVHEVLPDDPGWCSCGRPSLTSAAPCEGLLAQAEGRAAPSMSRQEWMPLPTGSVEAEQP